MSDTTLSSFSYIVCRDILPTFTSRVLFSRFKKILSSERIFSIRSAERIKGEVPLQLISDSNNQVLIFNAHLHKDRNRNGIVLVIRTAKSSVIFSGDVHYSQISNWVLSHVNYSSRNYFIVPHHGGNAGKFVYALKGEYRHFFPAVALVSVGRNSYGHPLIANLGGLRASGFLLQRTDLASGDLTINL